MDVHVGTQNGRVLEGFITFGAFVRTQFGVHPLVGGEFILPLECFATNRALVRLLIAMDESMQFHVLLSHKRFRTQITFIGTFTGMASCMLAQTLLGFERLPTESAQEAIGWLPFRLIHGDIKYGGRHTTAMPMLLLDMSLQIILATIAT